MKQLISGLALGCSLLATTLPAGAAALTASASITNIRFTVTDLNPNDGIDASYAFIANPRTSAERYYPSGSVADTGSLTDNGMNVADGAFSLVNRIVFDGGDWGYAAAVGSDSLSATAHETRGGAWGHAGAMVSAGLNSGTSDAPVLQRLLLVLSPHTELVFTADLTTSSELDCSPADQLAYNCYATAYAYAHFGEAYSLATGQLSHGFLNTAGGIFTDVSNNERSSIIGGVVSGYNHSDEYLVVNFAAHAYANGHLMGVSQVPEPSSLALALCALAPLAVAARSRCAGSSQGA